MTAANMILNYGNTGKEVTVYTIETKERHKKVLVVIAPAKSTQQQQTEPSETKIVDLQRITTRFTVTGYIDSADKDKLRDCFKFGSDDNGENKFALKMLWTPYSASAISGVLEDLEMTTTAREEQDEIPVMFTYVTGVRLG